MGLVVALPARASDGTPTHVHMSSHLQRTCSMFEYSASHYSLLFPKNPRLIRLNVIAAALARLFRPVPDRALPKKLQG